MSHLQSINTVDLRNVPTVQQGKVYVVDDVVVGISMPNEGDLMIIPLARLASVEQEPAKPVKKERKAGSQRVGRRKRKQFLQDDVPEANKPGTGMELVN